MTQNCPDPNFAGLREGTILLSILLMLKAGVQVYRLSVKKNRQFMSKEMSVLELRIAALEQIIVKKEKLAQKVVVETVRVKVRDAGTQTDPTEERGDLHHPDEIILID